jgi:hypothetical protein
MTTPTDIDRDAPVIAHHEIDITAPLDTVWSLHTRVNAWPSWNQEMTDASLHGPFEAGNSFTWTSYGFTVTSTIYEVDDQSRTLWGGVAQGITGTHEWRFEPTAEGVHVTTTESLAGDPVDADTAGMQTILDNSLVAWLGQAEDRSRASLTARSARVGSRRFREAVVVPVRDRHRQCGASITSGQPVAWRSRRSR